MTTTIYKALSALLSYPSQDLKNAAQEIRTVIADESRAPAWAIRRVDPLIDDLRDLDLYELQERYVFLFDRTRSLSLHLFEHVHGESRDRGQAMVDLKSLYAQGGLEISASELPDYLPLFLEFLSTRTAEEARALLAEPLSVLVALKERLEKRTSSYAGVFVLLEQIAGSRAPAAELDELRKVPDDDPNDLEALDRAWADEPVTFGPGDQSCPKAEDLIDRMRAGDAGGRGAG